MDNSLKIFDYNGAKVRTVMQNGEPWFVAKDVCDVLGINNARKAVSSLADDEKNTVTFSYGNQNPRGNPNFNVVNEPGLYRLIFRSNRPEAEQFKHWVFHEVLMDIHKHGMYLSDKTQELYKNGFENFKQLLDNYVAERDKNKELQKTIDAERPFSILGHMVLALPDSMTVKDAADLLAQHGIDIGQNRLFKRLREDGWVCKRKGKQWNKPTKKAIDNGFLNVQIENGFNTVTMILPKGFNFLSNLFVSENYPLLVLLQGETE